ncbi:uncharacterized protein Bfra_009759 [Botrytis fragariae]|uniref:Uncharacterized protein n=1 Tax=Botrytis fragariae TaxID=1964551 RepID=A0A8H6EFU7_9HELO|nr:uncharacterized protein Bfra_009759 [Botrytis fragariae]KAF5870375.1 hypothetical protein Bfra_009759 [Botrytis fragariae]
MEFIDTPNIFIYIKGLDELMVNQLAYLNNIDIQITTKIEIYINKLINILNKAIRVISKINRKYYLVLKYGIKGYFCYINKVINTTTKEMIPVYKIILIIVFIKETNLPLGIVILEHAKL